MNISRTTVGLFSIVLFPNIQTTKSNTTIKIVILTQQSTYIAYLEINKIKCKHSQLTPKSQYMYIKTEEECAEKRHYIYHSRIKSSVNSPRVPSRVDGDPRQLQHGRRRRQNQVIYFLSAPTQRRREFRAQRSTSW